MLKACLIPVLLLATQLFAIPAATQALSVIDDQGNEVTLPAPAARVISLGPHLAELVFSAGSGHTLVGVVRFSNYPEQVTELPVVGDASRLDLERIIALQPDLVIAWESFTGPEIEQLRTLGIPVYVSASDSLDNIGRTLVRIGTLTGTEQAALAARSNFTGELTGLGESYSGRVPVSVLYEFWHDPIYTVNGDHLISEVIRLCGGNNVFADMPVMTGTVTLESVIAADPQVILTSGADENPPAWLQEWYGWPGLQAVTNEHVYHVPPDLIQRPAARIVEGARMMCEYIDAARGKGK